MDIYTITSASLAAIDDDASNAKSVLEAAQSEILEATIRATRYNQSRAATALGVSRGTLRKLLEVYFPGEYIGKLSHKGRPR